MERNRGLRTVLGSAAVMTGLVYFLAIGAGVACAAAESDPEPADEPGTETTTASDHATGEEGDGETPQLEENVEVVGEAPHVDTAEVALEELHSGRMANLGVALASIPGVQGVRRSQDAAEPVVRGLGWERVQTQVDGMPLYGACPARMDPPATIVSPQAIQQVEVVKGLASVSLGPGGTGGRLTVSTDYDRGSSEDNDIHPWVRASYNGARDGYTAGAGVEGGAGKLDYSLGIEKLTQNDYTSADGTRVPARQDDSGAYATFGHRPTDSQRWHVGAVYQEGRDIDYPSLPMNTDAAETSMLNGTYSYQPTDGSRSFVELDARLGFSRVDHRMSNQRKPNRMMMEAQTDSTADSAATGVSGRWQLSTRSTLQVGGDYSDLRRDAIRTRHIVMSGRDFYDHLWPDVGQDNLGLFAEYVVVPGPGWQVRLGGRYDAVSSEAAAADDPGLGGNTIRENYVLFYGPEAAITDRDENLWSGNVLLNRQFTENTSVFAGVGLVSRAAGMTERYFSFAPAPGGFTVGNPTLNHESKRELSAGFRFGSGRVRGAVSVYYFSFGDYIKDTTLTQYDADNDGDLDLIRGFRNVDATLIGGEFSATFQASDRITVPVSLMYVRGEYGPDGTPLPEIPPLDATAAARMTFPGKHNAWVELGGRFVARQDRVDPDFPTTVPPTFRENPTPGFDVWHLRGRVTLFRYFDLDIGIENLFNGEYHEHLTREAFFPVGDLMRGDEIPQPGRFLFVGAGFRY